MSNGKRFLSVILAMIMMLSTLVVGASAVYTEYKGSAIVGQYNSLDKPVLTTAQYASAAMDEVDRMLAKANIQMNVYIGDLDATSIDAAMDSVYGLKHSRAFDTAAASGMLGDLKNLNVEAFKPESEGGVRRTTAGKTDVDIIYAVLQLLYDNRGLIVSFVKGTINLGSVVSSFIDVSEIANVNKLLKGVLYKATYDTEAPETGVTQTIDTMVQDLINKVVLKEVPALEGKTDISTGSMYDFIDEALKTLYNTLLVDLLNGNVKYEINKFCGVVYTKDDQGNITDTDKSNLNQYASLINIDYTIPTYTFTSGTFVDNINNIIKSVLDEMLNSSVYVWQGGANSNLITNVTNLAKAVLVNTGDDFFASYIKVATPSEVNAMSTEELCTYALRAVINGSVHGMYIPDSVTTLREFGYYALSQLLATSVPQLDFSSLPKNSTDTLVIMGIDYAIYSVNSAIDMDLEYVTTMDGVDQQIKKAVNYAITNYGGLLNGVTFNTSASGWSNLNTLVFSIINSNCLPAAANSDIKTLVINCVIDNILDLDFDSLLSMFSYISGSELQNTPKQVIINIVARVVNIIFPGAIQSASTLEALATNEALGNTVNAIFTDLGTYKVKLVASILPTLCDILELTSVQKFKFPSISYDTFTYSSTGTVDFSINVRNSSTGINTAYRDVNNSLTQDSLYTYDIKSVTSNISTINLSNPGHLAGGQNGNIRVTGSFPGDTVFIVAITYDVLTEDGSPLTETPITQYVYSYLSKSAASDDITEFSAASGNFSITEGPLYLYASSMRDLYKMQLTVENADTANSYTVTPVSNIPSLLITTDSVAYLKLKEGTTNILPKVPDGKNGVAKTYVVQTTDEYNALTSEEKDAAWSSIVEKGIKSRNGVISLYAKYKCTTGVNVGGTEVTNANSYVFPYEDYNLGSMLSSEMGKHRQASAYSDSSAWATYSAAMEQAAKAVYSPFKNNTFAVNNVSGKAALYKPAYEALTAAIEALDACAISQGVASTQAIIDSFNPSNEDIEYDDAEYNYFGVADYKAYTYYNYRKEYKSASSLIKSATIPDETTGETKLVDALSLAYTNHRLTLYGNRLVPVVADKRHLVSALSNAVSMSDESKYSTESWAEYVRAYNFATVTNGEAVGTETSPLLKQSKVDTAYRELVEAQKRLVAPTSSGSEPVFTPVNPSDPTETAPEIVDLGSDGLVLTGVYGGEQFNASQYFDCTGCTVEATANKNDSISTGAIITIKNSTTGAVIATYTVCVTGDISGDSSVDSIDVSMASNFAAGSKEALPVEVMSADINGDSVCDSIDTSALNNVAAGYKSIDFANRVIV